MAVTEEIAWGDGTSDKIYLTADAFEGDQTVLVSSDANTGMARTKTVTFTTGTLTQTLTVSQESGIPIYSMSFNVTSYDTTNSRYEAFSRGYPASNGYAGYDSTNFAGAQWKNGSLAETKIYWKFNLSSLPSDATIISVELKAKVKLSTVANQTGQSYLVVCRGTTEVGAHKTANSQTASVYSVDCGSDWTRSNIQNIAIMYHTQRGTTNTSGGYQQHFFGATLTVKYTI